MIMWFKWDKLFMPTYTQKGQKNILMDLSQGSTCRCLRQAAACSSCSMDTVVTESVLYTRIIDLADFNRSLTWLVHDRFPW